MLAWTNPDAGLLSFAIAFIVRALVVKRVSYYTDFGGARASLLVLFGCISKLATVNQMWTLQVSKVGS